MDLNALLASFASAFGQDNRMLTLQLGGSLPPSSCCRLAWRARRGSRPYRYTLACLSPDASIPLKTLLGQPARIGIQGAEGAR